MDCGSSRSACSSCTHQFSALRVITCWTLNDETLCDDRFFFLRLFLLLFRFFFSCFLNFIEFTVGYSYSCVCAALCCVYVYAVYMCICVCLDTRNLLCSNETVTLVSTTPSICNECYMCYGLLILGLIVRAYTHTVLSFALHSTAQPSTWTCKRDPVLKHCQSACFLSYRIDIGRNCVSE